MHRVQKWRTIEILSLDGFINHPIQNNFPIERRASNYKSLLQGSSFCGEKKYPCSCYKVFMASSRHNLHPWHQGWSFNQWTSCPAEDLPDVPKHPQQPTIELWLWDSSWNSLHGTWHWWYRLSSPAWERILWSFAGYTKEEKESDISWCTVVESKRAKLDSTVETAGKDNTTNEVPEVQKVPIAKEIQS